MYFYEVIEKCDIEEAVRCFLKMCVNSPDIEHTEHFQSLTGKSPIKENRLRDHSGHVVCFFYYVPKAHRIFCCLKLRNVLYLE